MTTPSSFSGYAKARLPEWVRFARALCADAALAEDLVQEVLIKLHARWASVRVMDAPDAYVRRMLVNEFFSWRRKWWRVSPHDDPVRLLADDPAAARGDDFTSLVAEREDLLAEIVGLPARQRAAIGLRYLAGLDDAEIAKLLGCAPSTVRVHAARGLARLRITREQRAAMTGGEDLQ